MKILIPVDGSDYSRCTLEWAARTLNKNNNEYYLLTVISDPMIAEYKLEDAMEALKDARAYLEGQGMTVAKSEYLMGHPVERICQYAQDENIDQVLMGSHGRSGLAKVLLGSVSQGVLELCKKPVFIYRHHVSQMANSPL